MRGLVFLGDSRLDLRDVPEAPRREFGFLLFLLQTNPEQARLRGHLKKFPGGSGYWRIRVGEWRLTYVVKNEVVYVVRVSRRENAYSAL
jgi:mRNA-degrading endonuclease RelE of RelBE toxin-antitoxin system